MMCEIKIPCPVHRE